MSLLYDRALAPSGLGVNQYAILAELNRRNVPVTLGELASTMVMDRSALGHNLRPLERDRLVAVATSKEDRRSRAISLTAAGRKRFTEAKKHWRVAQEQFEKSIGSDQAAALRGLLATAARADYSDAI